jgi:hypothetical protein
MNNLPFVTNTKKIDEQIKPLQTARDEITATVKESLRKEPTTELSEKEIRAAFSEEQKKRDGELAKELDQLKKQKREFTLGLLMTDSDTSPPATKILFQGDYKTERDPVEPGFISALNPNPAEITKGKNQKTLGRRLTLANWIATENNPFTARVLVNRVWQQHFGRGLVATANDFGLAGASPSHPELLDWLADEFMSQGWSVKKLHRLIVTSATYRQASSSAGTESPTLIKIVGNRKSTASTDIENKLLARQNLRRLSAEQLRDSFSLFAANSLPAKAGHPSGPNSLQKFSSPILHSSMTTPKKRKAGIHHPKNNRTSAAFSSSRSEPSKFLSSKHSTFPKTPPPARVATNRLLLHKRSRSSIVISRSKRQNPSRLA